MPVRIRGAPLTDCREDPRQRVFVVDEQDADTTPALPIDEPVRLDALCLGSGNDLVADM